MATLLPLLRSFWYYAWRWIAITSAFFIWVVIDWFDVVSRLFPTLEEREPHWMGATVEIGIFPLLALIASMIVATVLVVRKAAGRAATQDPQSRLRAISHRLETLMNTWEQAHPAGAEAWRGEVKGLSQEAEQIIRTEYSAEEAAKFRGLKPEDAREYSKYIEKLGEIDDPTKRELLLQAKIKFLFELVHGSGN